CGDLATASTLALAIAAEAITPSAIEVAAPSADLFIRFETTERAAEQMAAAACAILTAAGATTNVISGPAEQRLWKQHESSIWDQPGLVAKISVLPTAVDGVLRSCASAAAGRDW